MAGRFVSTRECCQLRLLVGAPRHNRMAVYERVRREGGEVAVEELKVKLRKELQRQRDKVDAERRREQEANLAVGRAATAALLKEIKENSMHLAPSERATSARIKETA